MTTRLIMFAAWCLSLLSGFAWAGYQAWSPYSDEGPRTGGSTGGPSHK
jgi:hypothetical protein